MTGFISPGSLEEAFATRSARPIDDVRASAEYRRALIPGLFYQGMYDALMEA